MSSLSPLPEAKGNLETGGPGPSGSDYRAMDILGVRVHRVTMEQTLEAIDDMASDGHSHQVVTVNPEFIMTARWHHEFRRVLNGSSLALPDGMGIIWASRFLGRGMPERVTGSDLVLQFAPRAAKRGYRVFFLGAGPGVAEKAGSALAAKYPGLVIAGAYSGSPRPEEEPEIRSMIKSASPNVLFVAYGSPQQELWIDRNREQMGVPVSVGVGGALDFVAGVIPRAPAWMRNIGLEWLYRLAQQPHRWRRMLALPRFAWLVLLSTRKSDQRSGDPNNQQ